MTATSADGEAFARALFERLREDDLDGAIDAGLMRFVPSPAGSAGKPDAAIVAALQAARQRLLDAWAARDRYRTRERRLARRHAERAAKRIAARAPQCTAPPLPPAAAAALARAKARALTSS